MKILVTGGSGFIGTHLVIRLLAKGHQVRSLDLRQPLPDSRLDTGSFAHLAGDVREEKFLESAVSGVDCVIHLAAHTDVCESMQDPMEHMSCNVLGTANLVARCRGQVRRILLASSRAVYGEGTGACQVCGTVELRPRSAVDMVEYRFDARCSRCGLLTTPLPVPECCTTPPVSTYGLSKRAQEDLLRLYAESGTEIVVLRYFNVYGPSRRPVGTRLVNTFAAAIADGRELMVYEDGCQLRDFIHIDDAVQATVVALAAPAGTYNVGTGLPTSLNELAELIQSASGRIARVRSLGRARWGDVRHSYADVSRLQRDLGFEPLVSLYDGLRDLLRSLASLNAAA